MQILCEKNFIFSFQQCILVFSELTRDVKLNEEKLPEKNEFLCEKTLLIALQLGTLGGKSKGSFVKEGYRHMLAVHLGMKWEKLANRSKERINGYMGIL